MAEISSNPHGRTFLDLVNEAIEQSQKSGVPVEAARFKMLSYMFAPLIEATAAKDLERLQLVEAAAVAVLGFLMCGLTDERKRERGTEILNQAFDWHLLFISLAKDAGMVTSDGDAPNVH